MANTKKIEKGTFEATKESFRRKNERYNLKLYLPEFDCSIFIDIHDELCETTGFRIINSNFCKNFFSCFPNTIYITNIKGYWEIQNLSQILSDTVTRLI